MHLLAADLLQMDIKMGRDKFFDLLRKQGLLVRRPRKYASTTQSRHYFRVYKNLIWGWKPSATEQLWVSDITYLRTSGGFVYLFLITDAYSRKVVGWHLSRSLAIEGAVKALRMALKQCSSTQGLIHHSDRGIQYCCKAYLRILKKHAIKISMTEGGDCYQNALAERVNGILKQEYCLDNTFADHTSAKKATLSAIRLYNKHRPHLSLNMQTPCRIHEKQPELINILTWKLKEKRSKKENYNSNNSVY